MRMSKSLLCKHKVAEGGRGIFGKTTRPLHARWWAWWSKEGEESEDDSDIENGHLSYKSPLSKAMIGKSTDDLVELKTPEINQDFQVTDITYE